MRRAIETASNYATIENTIEIMIGELTGKKFCIVDDTEALNVIMESSDTAHLEELVLLIKAYNAIVGAQSTFEDHNADLLNTANQTQFSSEN